jgi:hypothetical protein
MDGGMVGPRAFAVFTLMTNSNFVGGFPGTRQNDSVHTVPRVHLGNVGRGEIAMRMTSMLLAAIAAMVATATFAQTPKIVMEEMMVPSGDPGIEIYVRNKRPADLSVFRPERTLLYVHGATYPSSTAFDLQLDGMSWMDYFAARGYDVYPSRPAWLWQVDTAEGDE